MKIHHLNFDWQYAPSFKTSYIKSFDYEEIVNIPHTNISLPFNHFNEKLYQFISSYQKIVEIDKDKDKSYILNFDGVMNQAEVFVNEQSIGQHKGGYTHFEFDITSQIKNGKNTIFVKVDSRESNNVPPYGFVVDYLTYGGIYREVYVEEKPYDYVKNATVYCMNKKINIRTYLENKTNKNVELIYEIKRDTEIIKKFKGVSKTDFSIKKVIELKPWTFDNPVLYTLNIYIDNILSYTSRFANREINYEKEGLFLNGQKIKLRGLNRHQSYPYVGYAMPKRIQRKDADILKYELGCNVVRSSHYPPSKHFLDRCDEIGLLVFSELPGWQHIGNEEWQKIALNNLREMILQDFNHPAIFIWGVRINESPDNHAFYTKTNYLAKKLDASRPTGGVRNFKDSELLEDVYTYNDFHHRGDNDGLESKLNITKKDVPYLVTEYNGHMYPTKKYDDETHRLAQLKRHLKVQNDSYKQPDISGAIGWCFADYNTHKDFGSGDRICYHGVLDMFRLHKDAASAYASQQNKNPFMHVASSLQIGDYEASEIKEVFVLTNADYIAFYINDDFIGKFFPTNNKNYAFLPHPPIIIDDFIGNLIHENESFSEKDSDIVKQILLNIMKSGLNLKLFDKIKMAYIMFKYKIKKDEAAKLYEKYVGKWGLESLTYTFKAYKNKELILTQKRGPFKTTHLVVEPDVKTLKNSDTYDVTRVVVKHLDNNKQLLTYSTEVIIVQITGPLELIGPTTLSLIGGSTAFYVKTINEKGSGEITVKSNNFKKTFKLTIQ
ncbi:MAG: glycoside hydrolase family 2 protein [Candidatus Izimaplasma sp.]|nr:glycoside hydrolase family 2 protein [Candidatus Izimaplasma bacterium]